MTICQVLSVLLANHWTWRWSWQPLLPQQSWLKIPFTYLLWEGVAPQISTVNFESQKPRLRGPDVLNNKCSWLDPPSHPNKDSNVFLGRRGWKGKVDTKIRIPEINPMSCPLSSWVFGRGNEKTCTVQGDLETKKTRPILTETEEVPRPRVNLREWDLMQTIQTQPWVYIGGWR